MATPKVKSDHESWIPDSERAEIQTNAKLWMPLTGSVMKTSEYEEIIWISMSRKIPAQSHP